MKAQGSRCTDNEAVVVKRKSGMSNYITAGTIGMLVSFVFVFGGYKNKIDNIEARCDKQDLVIREVQTSIGSLNTKASATQEKVNLIYDILKNRRAQ